MLPDCLGQVLNMIKGKAEQHDFLFDSLSRCSLNGYGEAPGRGKRWEREEKEMASQDSTFVHEKLNY